MLLACIYHPSPLSTHPAHRLHAHSSVQTAGLVSAKIIANYCWIDWPNGPPTVATPPAAVHALLPCMCEIPCEWHASAAYHSANNRICREQFLDKKKKQTRNECANYAQMMRNSLGFRLLSRDVFLCLPLNSGQAHSRVRQCM